MEITTIKSTHKQVVSKWFDDSTYYFEQFGSKFIPANPRIKGFNGNLEPDDLNLISENQKILFSLNIGLYNFYYIGAILILKAHKQNPDATFVLDTSGLWADVEANYVKFLLKLLVGMNIKFIILGDKVKKMHINNFGLIDRWEISNEDIEYFRNSVFKYLNIDNVEPFRKVYISRSAVSDRTFSNVHTGLNFNSDNRMNGNDKELEDSLKEIGFEIIVPEKDFKTFEDQIIFFNETKMLASLTSSGISNLIFMQNESILIEFITPLIQLDIKENDQNHLTENIHHLYHAMSYNKNNLYIGIPNNKRNTEDIIKKLKRIGDIK